MWEANDVRWCVPKHDVWICTQRSNPNVYPNSDVEHAEEEIVKRNENKTNSKTLV